MQSLKKSGNLNWDNIEVTPIHINIGIEIIKNKNIDPYPSLEEEHESHIKTEDC